jgi:acetyl-CoA C-acetyltransferase
MAGTDLSRVAVVATAQTQLRESWDDKQHVDLIYAAVSDVLAGSGLGIADVDVVIDCGSDVLDGRSISNCGFLGAMGAHHKEESRVEEDGLWGASYAMNKIASGHAKVALVVAYSKPSESDVAAYYASIAEPFFSRPVGLDQDAALGLLANQYLSVTGLPEDVLVQVAAHDWARAIANPNVQTPDSVDVAGSPLVAEPLRALQIARPLDGAVAVLLATEHIARRATEAPVWLTGAGSASESHLLGDRTPGEFPAAAVATAYRRAGIASPASFGFAEVSAGSAAAELMVLEALGLADQGKAVSLYDAGGRLAVNPSGGALPADPIMATGLVRLAEAAEQLSGRVDRGPAGMNTVGARSAVVHGSGGLAMQNHCVFTMEV